MRSQDVDQYLEWSLGMDIKVKQAEQEEVESEKFPNSKIQNFVLQSSVEDEAFKELESRLK